MKLIQTAKELGNGSRPVCLAIGVFDGVHLGHQQIIRQMVTAARQADAVALVVTFDQHPNAVVAPDRVPPRIYARSQKWRALADLGVEAVLEIPFDRPFSEKTGDRFVRELARDWGNLQRVCVGEDFVFGYRRSGNVALLQTLGAELHFQVAGLAPLTLDGQVVSSTRIREMIRGGNLDLASQMLGRPYAICGPVVAGDQIGRQLGFPTANLEISNLILPPNGVYAAKTKVHEACYPAALNIGLRPTVAAAAPQLRAEAYLLNFSGSLYGLELELEMGVKLRNEMRFASPAELRAQIEQDVARVRAGA